MFTYSKMATKKSIADELHMAIERIEKGELSYRKAHSMYGIPRSTLHDQVVGKVLSNQSRPATILTPAEESMLVQWSLHMADIGYGRTREQLCLTVKKILDKDGRQNPFWDNFPGRDWWYASGYTRTDQQLRLWSICHSGKRNTILSSCMSLMAPNCSLLSTMFVAKQWNFIRYDFLLWTEWNATSISYVTYACMHTLLHVHQRT